MNPREDYARGFFDLQASSLVMVTTLLAFMMPSSILVVAMHRLMLMVSSSEYDRFLSSYNGSGRDHHESL